MKKKLLFIPLILFALLFGISFYKYKNIHRFDYNAVKKNISLLSSSYFKGRMGGTLENEETARYIESQFKSENLEKFNSNYYYQVFKTSYPKKVAGTPYLKVINSSNNSLVKEYLYGKDFKEDMLSFKQNHAILYRNFKFAVAPSYLKIKCKDNTYVFYATENNDVSFRSSFDGDNPYSMFIITTKQTLNELKNYLINGYIVDCFIPYTNDSTNLKNIVGYIKGKSSKNPIVISAHFDHMGTDLNGTVYGGALDNASGTSFVIEMSKFLKSLGTPDRDIIFAAFNGEEFGLKGSSAFVDKYLPKLKDADVFNFDMVGSPKSAPLCLMGSKKDSSKTPLIEDTAAICKKDHIYFNYLFEDASDHSPFRKDKVSAITFCDNDTSRIHTPSDTYKYISADSINRCFDVSSKEIMRKAYGLNPLVLYNRQIMIFSLCGFIASFMIIIVVNLKNKAN
ncbi:MULTISPECIES: M28 family metallopeptidase [Clostridium]|uniref:M28 family metallopeptidase n=1 Tax=Clostridium TaxID=1485 RepID=UPI0008270414|nr:MULTISPECIES: M28 family metallopeptidase [Clostridium]PJI09206.1 aminopeptidase [Clostridium sp. CT7]